MKKFQCPHCGQYSIRAIDKALLDIKYNKKCKVCGGKYGPPYGWSALLSLIILIIFIFIILIIKSLFIKIILSVFLITISDLINLLFMPIKKKES